MVENLDAKNVDNTVFVPTHNKDTAVIQPNDNVCVCECFKKWDRLVFDFKQAKIFNALQKHIDVSQFDVIHAYTVFTDGNCARKLSKKYKIPYVVAVRNTDINVFLKKAPYLRNRCYKILREASAVFFLSDAYKRELFDSFIPRKYRDEIMRKVQVIPNGIDAFWFENQAAPKPQPEDKIKLVFAGKVDKNKNITTTQRAMALLRERGIPTTLTVVGKVKSQEEFEKVKSDAFTTYIPAKPKEELIDVYRGCDLFVMPSYHESFGLVYAEAMSQGLPVIYSKGQGFDGQFDEGEVGFAVDASSAEQIADRIVAIMQEYSAFSERSVKGCSKFSWDDICERYVAIYTDICNGN